MGRGDAPALVAIPAPSAAALRELDSQKPLTALVHASLAWAPVVACHARVRALEALAQGCRQPLYPVGEAHAEGVRARAEMQSLEVQSKRVRELAACCLSPDEPPRKKTTARDKLREVSAKLAPAHPANGAPAEGALVPLEEMEDMASGIGALHSRIDHLRAKVQTGEESAAARRREAAAQEKATDAAEREKAKEAAERVARERLAICADDKASSVAAAEAGKETAALLREMLACLEQVVHPSLPEMIACLDQVGMSERARVGQIADEEAAWTETEGLACLDALEREADQLSKVAAEALSALRAKGVWVAAFDQLSKVAAKALSALPGRVEALARDAKGESLVLREVLKLVPALLEQAAPPLSHPGWQ
ncbi:hypothetical protein T484DRAFT_1824718, partial [Baffinella frigidus]